MSQSVPKDRRNPACGPRTPGGRATRPGDGGFTLLEVIAAVVILTVGLLAAAVLISRPLGSAQGQEQDKLPKGPETKVEAEPTPGQPPTAPPKVVSAAEDFREAVQGFEDETRKKGERVLQRRSVVGIEGTDPVGVIGPLDTLVTVSRKATGYGQRQGRGWIWRCGPRR